MILTVKNNKLTATGGLKIKGMVIEISQSSDEPIIIRHEDFEESQVIINLAKGINAKIIEDNTNNLSLVINLADNAYLNYLSYNNRPYAASMIVNIGKNANFISDEIFASSTNAKLEINLLEENANANINCLVLNKETDSSLNVYVRHQEKRTNSFISNYGVAVDKANISFNVTGKIEQHMANSNCRQLTKGVIVGQNASILAKPVLLIDEYDVSAYHGASIGKMSDEDLFYLMSRGLTKTEAFKLMLTGIISPFIERILDDSIKNEMKDAINKLI